MGATILIKNNKNALMTDYAIILFGLVMVGISSLMFQTGLINAPIWMVLIGIGMYMAHIPFNIMIIERIIAVFKSAANVAFMMYVADAFCYLGSTGALLYKTFRQSDLSWLSFFMNFTYAVSIIGSVLTLWTIHYFYRKQKGIA